MIDVDAWKTAFLDALRTAFGPRVLFAGLQGSYARGESREGSDLDVVVILDRLDAEDVCRYGRMLDGLPHRDKVCGFLGGRAQLEGWDPGERLQLCLDTTPWLGSLWQLTGPARPEQARAAVRTGAGTVYHGCVHLLLYDRDPGLLRGLYKTACFTARAEHFARTGENVRSHRALAQAAQPDTAAVVRTALELEENEPADWEDLCRQLMEWAGARLARPEKERGI